MQKIRLKQHHQFQFLFLFFLLSILALSIGCSSPAENPTPSAETETEPLDAEPTAEVAVAPTATPEPPTATLSPTLEPTPAPIEPTAEPTATRAGIELPNISVPNPVEEIDIPEISLPGEVVETLGARWYEDSDGNLIPDFVEIETGYNPLIDDCSLDQCVGVELSSELTPTPPPVQNLLILFDASGSMQDPLNGQPKIELAREGISRFVENNDLETKIGLIAFGHQGDGTEGGKPASCAGVELIAPLGEITPATIGGVLDRFEPNGWTPLGAALTAAESALAGAEGEINHIILVTDGLETCGGDPVAEAVRLNADPGILLTVDVFGIGITAPDEVQALRAIAEGGGGRFLQVDTPDLFVVALSDAARNSVSETAVRACQTTNQVPAGTCYLYQNINTLRYINDFSLFNQLSEQAEASLETLLSDIDTAFQTNLAQSEE